MSHWRKFDVNNLPYDLFQVQNFRRRMPLWFRAWEQGGQAKIALRVDSTKHLLELSKQGMLLSPQTESPETHMCLVGGVYAFLFSPQCITNCSVCSSDSEVALLRCGRCWPDTDSLRLQHCCCHWACSSLPHQPNHRPPAAPVRNCSREESSCSQYTVAEV